MLEKEWAKRSSSDSITKEEARALLTAMTGQKRNQSLKPRVDSENAFSRLYQTKTRDVEYWTSKKEMYDTKGCTFKPAVDEKSKKIVEKKYRTQSKMSAREEDEKKKDAAEVKVVEKQKPRTNRQEELYRMHKA